MISSRATLVAVIAAALVVAPAFATRTHRTAAGSPKSSSPAASVSHKSSSSRSHSTGHKATSKRVSARSKGRSHKLHGQQAIDPQRVTQIQQALIREHYLSGEASGEWDSTTQAAMQKYQSDHGWQTRLMPDSRALKNLGLGPDYSGALNAKDSSFAPSASASTVPAGETAGFTAASGVN